MGDERKRPLVGNSPGLGPSCCWKIPSPGTCRTFFTSLCLEPTHCWTMPRAGTSPWLENALGLENSLGCLSCCMRVLPFFPRPIRLAGGEAAQEVSPVRVLHTGELEGLCRSTFSRVGMMRRSPSREASEEGPEPVSKLAAPGSRGRARKMRQVEREADGALTWAV